MEIDQIITSYLVCMALVGSARVKKSVFSSTQLDGLVQGTKCSKLNAKTVMEATKKCQEYAHCKGNQATYFVLDLGNSFFMQGK